MIYRLAAQGRYGRFFLVLLGLGLFLSHALIAVAASPQLAPAIAMTEGKTQQGFPYLSGGVSTDEREVMEREGNSYNVKLSFADNKGSYLSDVELVIEDSKGAQIVSITTNGPWFYVQLPTGNYAVKATFNGQTKEIKNLSVSKNKTTRQILVWDLGEQS